MGKCELKPGFIVDILFPHSGSFTGYAVTAIRILDRRFSKVIAKGKDLRKSPTNPKGLIGEDFLKAVAKIEHLYPTLRVFLRSLGDF